MGKYYTTIKIYCIEDHCGKKYIGSTTTTLKHRLIGHKHTSNSCSSNKLDLYSSFIYTIEECDEEHRKEREQYWIDNTDCVNIRNALPVNKKEYHKNMINGCYGFIMMINEYN